MGKRSTRLPDIRGLLSSKDGKFDKSLQGEVNMSPIFIDGDFDSGKGNCKYHCSPTCHPAQVGSDWKYGCRHPAWPQNKYGDFVPIVECGGNRKKCEANFKYFIIGLKRRKNNLEKKLELIKEEIAEHYKQFPGER
jgi:hypothetical protein